ncbi:MAG: glycoside hydrolase family 16 protein [Rikenellaceae bacterium]
MRKVILILASVVLSTTALWAQSSEACIDFNVSQGKSNNYVILTNISHTSYDTLTWDLNDGRVKNLEENQSEFYFPFKGEYEVSLIGEADGLLCKRTRSVTIAQDDPNYEQNFKLVWSDEFDGDSVNMDNWTFETGATGWGNNELQNYTDGENAAIKDGELIITARRVAEGNKVKRGGVTSTRMVTKDKQEFLYGRVEMRAKMPSGVGLWAAFWMLGANFPDTTWPYCGEIDIMEYVGYDKDVQNVAMHNGSSSGRTRNKAKVTLEGMETEYHIYGIVWDKYCIKFYIDDVENVIYTYQPDVYDSNTWPHSKPHFILLNLAVGGDWGGKMGVDVNIFPADYAIDYVRVYQNPEF